MYNICNWLQHSKFLMFFLSWPPLAVALEVMHYIGIFIMVGSIVLVDLRVLGIAAHKRKLGEFAAQLFPYAWFGLAMIVVSGFLMFTSQAADYYNDPTFHKKMIVMLLALVAAVFIRIGAPKWESAGAIPLTGKVVALVCMVLMFETIIYGNLVPAISGIG